jgi:sugar phosphate isomerase/epimerase
MKLALSGRIAEAPHEKTQALINLPKLAESAARIGYEALEIRNSQLDAGASPARVVEVRQALDENGLAACCLVADSATEGRFSPRFDEYLDLALRIGAQRIRPSIGSIEQIPLVRNAADQAAALGVDLVQFTHHGTPFNTVAGSLDMLRRVNRSNVGLVFEAANLYIEGQDYGLAAVRALAPHIQHAEVQNMLLVGEGEGIPISAQGGYVQYRNLRVDDSRGVDISGVVASLKAIGYDGWLVMHSPNFDGMDPLAYAAEAHDYLRTLIDG